MTRPRRNSGVPLPHTSLLTFFPNCSPPIPPITCADLPSPPPYTPSAPPPTPRPYHVLPVINEDEEWNHGFWGEKTAYGEKSIEICQVGQDDDDEEEYDLYDEFCFYAGVIVCVLACFGVVFVLGLMGKYWNLSIGSPAWMGRWEDESKVEVSPVVTTHPNS